MSLSVAYHASHEQFSPSELLSLVQLAEKAGFDAIHSSDHFHPWSERQGHSGFTLSWIGAAMQACGLPFSMVCAPGQRLHPAIVAQAIATLGDLFPGRFSIELGSGEALNEMITGEPWPDKETRNARLLECVHVIRALLKGDEIDHHGLVRVKESRLYSIPTIIPPLFCAAISKKTSGWAGKWADGLLTTAGPDVEIRDKITAFESEGGRGKPVYVQFAFSFDRTLDLAIEGAFDQWRSNMVAKDELANLHKPAHFDQKAAGITRADIEDQVPMFTDVDLLFERVISFEKLGAARVVLHNINRNQEQFINAMAGALNHR
jgi:probable non-F420 flavinoid oxidoreductase